MGQLGGVELVFSFRDDGIKMRRIEVGWWVGIL